MRREGRDEAEDEIDWEEILLDGFDAGGRKQQFEQKEYFQPTAVETPDLEDSSWSSSTTWTFRSGRSGWERRSSGISATTAPSPVLLEEVLHGVNTWLDEVRAVAWERARRRFEDEEDREEEDARDGGPLPALRDG